jgi:hypothetical protein
MNGSVHPTRQRFRAAALAAVAVGGTAVALAPTATAAGLIPSTVTVTASPSSGTAPTSVTLTAKVAAAIVGGLIITPGGQVAFSYTSAAGSGALGSGTLGSCLLSACTATLTTSALPAGTNTVTASYAGDGVVAGNSGTTTVTLAAPPPPPPPPPPTPTGSSSTVTCNAGQYCQAAVKTSNGANTMNVLSSPSSTQQTVSGQLENGKKLHCPQNTDNQNGALGTFEVTVNDTTKTVTYTGYGNTASSMLANYNRHPDYAGCFGSVDPFNGFVGGTYGPAVFVSSDGLYEAQPATCAAHPLPCITVSSTSTSTTYTLSTPFGDPPKIIG